MATGLERPETLILEILKLAVDDIDRMKQQQWRDFYAILAVQAGLLVLFKDHLPLRGWFIVLSGLAGLLGGLLIGHSQHTLDQKFRPRLERALAALGTEFTDMWGPGPGRSKYPVILLLVLGIGTAFTILVMLHS